MNLDERTMMIIAMETIARRINDEDVFEFWLSNGIPDGDIDVFNDTYDYIKAYVYDTYSDDEAYADLMDSFVYMMKLATKGNAFKGALYSDGIVSRPE